TGRVREADFSGIGIREADRETNRAKGLTRKSRPTRRIMATTPVKPDKQKDAEKRNRISRRIAQELRDGYYANLGIGLPTLVASHVPLGIDVIFQSENGMLGVGPYP